MEQSPSLKANPDISSILWNPKAPYCVHNSLPLISIQSQISPVHMLPSHLSKINVNIIFPSTHVLQVSFLLFSPLHARTHTSAFGKSLCAYKKHWKWCLRASIQAWTHLIFFAHIFCRSACEMFLMNAVTAVFNSLSVCGQSRYTADFAA
jgi:heme/copper-type cytochrome/quinol oxidase subunit 4